jgi:hypothetical protein
VALFRLPGWWIRGVRARRAFRRACAARAFPPQTARRLAGRYRCRGCAAGGGRNGPESRRNAAG